MLDDGVSTRRGIMCSHLEPAYAGRPQPHDLQHSEQAQQRCILLPLFPGMPGAEQQQVAASLRRACKLNSSSVRRGLAA
jgi:dTDP-4-amino-4,6-dideoxygalactose transaminase